MAKFGTDNVLYDPLSKISKKVRRAVTLNTLLVKDTKKITEKIEKERKRTLRNITKEEAELKSLLEEARLAMSGDAMKKSKYFTKLTKRKRRRTMTSKQHCIVRRHIDTCCNVILPFY